MCAGRIDNLPPEHLRKEEKKKPEKEKFEELMKVDIVKEVDPEEKKQRKRPEEKEGTITKKKAVEGSEEELPEGHNFYKVIEEDLDKTQALEKIKKGLIAEKQKPSTLGSGAPFGTDEDRELKKEEKIAGKFFHEEENLPPLEKKQEKKNTSNSFSETLSQKQKQARVDQQSSYKAIDRKKEEKASLQKGKLSKEQISEKNQKTSLEAGKERPSPITEKKTSLLKTPAEEKKISKEITEKEKTEVKHGQKTKATTQTEKKPSSKSPLKEKIHLLEEEKITLTLRKKPSFHEPKTSITKKESLLPETKKEYFPEIPAKVQEEINLFSTTGTLPPPIEAHASIAASASSSFIPAEMHMLFEKMVGSILYIQDKGISRTEVTLNMPDLASSPFYGSTLILEKYATAPNSFNITLTGEPLAVSIFAANIDGLRQAFDNAKFDFTIGKLSAEYRPNRPLIRRKKELKGKE